MSDHYTREDEGKVGSIFTEEQARKAHHLASADPEPERDGLMTGAAHERKYGLERAEATEANWRGHGVHPVENRALTPGEDGYENLRGASDFEVRDAGSSSRAAKQSQK